VTHRPPGMAPLRTLKVCGIIWTLTRSQSRKGRPRLEARCGGTSETAGEAPGGADDSMPKRFGRFGTQFAAGDVPGQRAIAIPPRMMVLAPTSRKVSGSPAKASPPAAAKGGTVS
jgi:hypothetical protein